ncbi:transmembrane protein 39A-like [Daphnia carinata]|uniref:transmembrane protein 39A-like n=1 Tax=Daphnia carinata TaxID=120202 RepID=UPI00257DA04B|nr:transmembrane protein 39A-like [Daphnia carinata]
MRSIRRASVVNHRNAGGSNMNPSLNFQNNHKPAISSEGVNLNYMRTFQSDPNSPKHISISYASSDHCLIYESVVFFYSLSAFLLQLLHLYRTVWWLPQSYEKNAVKFYLVNPYVIGFVLTLIIPRWLWTCCKTLITSIFPQSLQEGSKQYCQIILLAALGTIHFYLLFLISAEDANEDKSCIKGNPLFRLGCLLYPTFVMAATYREEIRTYLELIPNQTGINDVMLCSSQLQHRCSNDPIQVRQEVETLRKDFNGRLRNVLFHSHMVAVTCTLLPCCFAQTFVHFDMHVAIQHFVLVWAGSLTLNAVHAFPPKYCDMLHSAARHLGYWERMGTNTSPSMHCAEWCSRTIWKQGSLVLFDSVVYRARSDLNSAEPGSVHHKRFYALFINAALFQISLLVFQLVLVLLQLILLFRSNEWYQMISLSLLQASGGYALFKLMRDAVVVWRLSLAEEMLKNA